MTDFFRVQLGVVSRAEGHSAAKRAAYQSCGTILAHDGERFDFSRKAAEHIATIMLMPKNAPDWTRDPESLWQRAAAAERRVDAQEARIVDFSLPRVVPAELWEACIRHVYQPFIDMGMAMQIDIHDSPASDGGSNINVHGLATLRQIDGDGFAVRKDRTWNDRFRERSGRVVREQFAERLTAFCKSHGIDYQGDARSNNERDRPAPEPELPKWNFETWKREGEMTEALAALQEHRKRRREWEAAQADEIAAALNLAKIETRIRERRLRRLAPVRPAGVRADGPDRRAAVLRAWHGAQGWIDAETVAAIRTTRFDEARSCLWIDLWDGSTLLDRGDSIHLRGRLTWQAAMETAAAAERHGWSEVTVSGDQGYKDSVTVAAMLRGITVINHQLSPKAQAQLDRLLAERTATAERQEQSQWSRKSAARYENGFRGLASHEIHQRITKLTYVAAGDPASARTDEVQAPVLKPRVRKSRQRPVRR
ncbi:MAG: MobA/MobL family protein [Mesorhizobium sp.]